MLVGDILRRNIKLRPTRPAITFAGRDISYAQLGERVNRAANALATLGVQKEDRVAVLSQNCPEYLELYFADGVLGAVTTPLNYRLTPPELEYIINDSEAVVLIVADNFIAAIEPIRERLTHVRHFVTLGPARPDWRTYEELVHAAAATARPAAVVETDLIWQMYTSGTTGRPKGAMISHRNLLTNVTQIGLEFDLREGDRALIVAPVYHAAAMIVSMVTLAGGGTLVLKRDFIPPEVLQAFAAEGVTHALLVPAMILFLLNMPGIEKVDFGGLKQVMYGASAIPLEVLRKALALFKCKFSQGFGQTESVAVLTSLGPDDHVLDGPPEKLKRLKSCGRELFGCDVRIVDENGGEVKRGELGEVVARGDQVMRGYWKLPEATAEALRDGWLHTGDLGTMDEDGYVYIMDRLKDMIVSGGENVYPREIEEVLFAHAAVADVACIGVPSDKWGEEVKAIVVLKPGATATAEDLLLFTEGRLAGYKRPRSIDFATVLPKNPSGKVLKRELREPYWQGKDRRVN